MLRHTFAVLSLVLLSGILVTSLSRTEEAAASAGTEPYIGEVMLWPMNFPPRGWAFCHGQLLKISQNTALFSLLGTMYGGDGRQTFGLPDLRGRVPVGAGNGPGLTLRKLASRGGEEAVALALENVPLRLASVAGEGSKTEVAIGSEAPSAGKAHPNMQPYVTLNYVICLSGVYPSRN